MSLIVFTKSYSNLDINLLFVVIIIAVCFAVNFEQIPEGYVGKMAAVITMLPFIVIYLISLIIKLANSPDELLIDIEKKTIDIKSKKKYAFADIEAFITLKNEKYELYITDKKRKVILTTEDYYKANMHEKDIKEHFKEFDNLTLYSDESD